MATTGNLPALGFGAGLIGYVVTLGFGAFAASRYLSLGATWEPTIALAAQQSGTLELEAQQSGVLALTGRWE